MYSAAGHFTAHVRAFDNEGGSTDATTRVTVTSAAAAAARTLLGTAQGSVDRRHTKITFTTRTGRGATLSVTIRLIDKFSNRVDKHASAKIRH